MKLSLIMLLGVTVMCMSACERHQPDQTENKNDAPLTLKDIHERGIVGELGVPMGKVVVVEGTVVDGRTIHHKRFRFQYLLKVNSVNGAELAEKPIMEFYKAPGCFLPQAAEDSTELREYHEMQVEDNDFKLSDEAFKKAHEAYVGSSLSLYVYEVGGYGGGPFDQFPEGAYDWSDHGFWFCSHLTVIMSADSKGDIEE